MANVVITGCNSGLGLELCRQLTARGDVVYAACRQSSLELDAAPPELGPRGGVGGVHRGGGERGVGNAEHAGG